MSSDKRERTFMPDASLKQYATDQGKVAVSGIKNEQTNERDEGIERKKTDTKQKPTESKSQP